MSSNDSSLLRAASEGDLEKVQQLIERHGANFNVQGALNRTPLHLASLSGKFEVVMYLVENANCQLDVQANSGETALHLAVLNGHTNIAEFLLEKGAKSDIKNNQGKLPKDYARKRPMKQLFEGGAQDPDQEFSATRKNVLKVNEDTITELVSAGYTRGEVLDVYYSFHEQGQQVGIVTLMRELETRKTTNHENQSNKNAKLDDDANTCKVCFENVNDCALVPCGHVFCFDCAKTFVNCPGCRVNVEQAIKMYTL